jgi:RNA polymerase sigma-70 factor (ECF subfamily)
VGADDDKAAEERQAEFVALFREHVRYVWKSLQRLGVREADCEDLTQETFIAVHRHLHERDPSRPVRPWLFGFAYRVALAHKRRKRTTSEVPTDRATLDERHDSSRDVNKALDARDAYRIVHRALAALPDEQRAVLVLHDLDGESAKEIATALDVPLNTVYSRLRLGRERFRAALGVEHATDDAPAGERGGER